MKKLRVGILFGGRSGEHEISLLSAASVLDAIDKDKYEVIPIGITKEGRWVTSSHAENLLRGKKVDDKHLRAGDPAATSAAAVLASGDSMIVPPMPAADSLVPFQTGAHSMRSENSINVDVIFPVMHGTFAEDGTIQGLLELADIAYVGAGVLGSAAGMDKDIMKQLFKAAGLPIVKHVTVLRSEWQREPKKVRREIEKKLKYPVFVKPANLGSSVGISKAHDGKELPAAMDEAASFDRKIVIEQGVGGNKKAREIECSVLGNDDPQASVAGEIVPSTEFYDYKAKYQDVGSQLLIPAKISKSQMKEVQDMAIAAFKAVDCSGLARVDFLMEPGSNGKLYLNEINTMPGFTSISMYPKLWKATGIEYADLIDQLIELGLARYAEKKKNRYSK
jgi:D-alanine-D-alanine ligase